MIDKIRSWLYKMTACIASRAKPVSFFALIALASEESASCNNPNTWSESPICQVWARLSFTALQIYFFGPLEAID
jgi:hypothetical protein